MFGQCRKRRWTLLLVTVFVCSYAWRSLAAEDELVKKLVGKWEGTVLIGSNEQRTLVIDSVKRDGDQWWADGRFGTAKGSKIDIKVTIEGNDVSIDFATPNTAKNPIHLKLNGDNELTGHMRTFQPARRANVNVPMTLKRVES